jgi:DNA-binding SARP family transcriptional activator/tetratricopeptide (TPR) repeat protein
MEFRVLGPVRVTAGGREHAPGPAQQQLVLASLALAAGELVGVPTLVDRVWARPPHGARRTLPVLVSRLRRLLEAAEPGAGVALLHRAGGYVLAADPDTVDAHRMRRLGEQARAPGLRPADRAATLRAALLLWRGEPLAGLTGPWAERTRDGLRRQYLDLVVAWGDAELATGNTGPVIDLAAGLAAESPLTEPLVAVLMRAYAAAGRPAEALRAYATTRARLVEELGVDPGRELTRLYAELRTPAPTRPTDPTPGSAPAGPSPTLAPTELPTPGSTGQIPTLGSTQPDPTPGPTPGPTGTDPTSTPARPSPTPAQLPADTPGFAGRDAQLERLDAARVAVVTGMPGIGKTTLAVHWAHRAAGRFPDGQLYVNLRGYEPGGVARRMAAGAALRGFLAALGVAPERVPTDATGQAALYRQMLAGRRVLVLLDNAVDAEQVRPLLPDTPTAATVITSRTQLSLPGASLVPVPALTAPEARHLLAYRIGADRVAAEPDAAAVITRHARLPLALAIVAARAADHPTFPLAALAADLADADRRLDALSAGDGDSATELRAVFSWSYAALGPGAAELFRLLSLAPGPDLGAAAVASLIGHPATAELAELTGANLLSQPGPARRYGWHDLLRDYAGDLARELPGAVRDAAWTRLLDHHLHTAHSAARLLSPHAGALALPLGRYAPGVVPEPLEDTADAHRWMAAERPVLLGLVAAAVAAKQDRQAWQLARCLEVYLDRRGHWHDMTWAGETALAAAERIGDPRARAQAHLGLSTALIRRREFAAAEAHLAAALEFYAAAGDHLGQGYAHNRLAISADVQGLPARALTDAERALRHFRVAGDRRGEALALNAVGWFTAQLGRYAEALTWCEQALPLFAATGDDILASETWDSLGYIHRKLRQHAKALDCYRQAADLARRKGSRYEEARALAAIGDIHLDTGDDAAARTAWQRSLAIYTDLGHVEATTVAAKLGRLSA